MNEKSPEVVSVSTLRQRVMEGSKGSDEFYTPSYALSPLVPFLKPEWVLWEPYFGQGHMVRSLQDLGYSVLGTDQGVTEELHGDCIVTNPPYSNKDAILGKCYQSGKPFALLLPLTALEGQFRQALYRQHGLEVILMNKRVNFIPPISRMAGYTAQPGKNGAWFATAWFTHGLNLPSPLLFTEIERSGLDGRGERCSG